MPRTLRKRYWVESVLAATTGILAVVPLLSREWIEVVFRVDPDGGSGSLEWTLVALFACTTVVAGMLARTEFRRAVVGLPSGSSSA